MSVNLEVPESRDDLEAVVDGLAAVSTLSQYLPIFEPGDDVLDAGADTAVLPVVGIVDDPAAVVALWADDDSDAAVSAIAQDDTVDRAGAQRCGGRRRRRCGYLASTGRQRSPGAGER